MPLFFPETLAILSDTGEPQGELIIEVQKGKYKDDLGILTHCLLVHASSRGFLDKSMCGSSLLGRALAAGCPSYLPSTAPVPIHRASVRTCPLTSLGRDQTWGEREGEGEGEGEVVPSHIPRTRTVLTTLSFSRGYISPAWASPFLRVHPPSCDISTCLPVPQATSTRIWS